MAYTLEKVDNEIHDLLDKDSFKALKLRIGREKIKEIFM